MEAQDQIIDALKEAFGEEHVTIISSTRVDILVRTNGTHTPISVSLWNPLIGKERRR